MNTIKYKVGDKVVCINAKPLSKTGFGPDLTEGKEYLVKRIHTECHAKGEFQHLHVGLETEFETIRSLDTGDKLPRTSAAWCHPSRFKLVTI